MATTTAKIGTGTIRFDTEYETIIFNFDIFGGWCIACWLFSYLN